MLEGFLKQYDAANLEKLNTLFAQVEKSTYGLPRENLDALTSVPVLPGVNPGAKSFTYKIISELGMAKFIASNARDLPPVSRAIVLKNVLIKLIGDSYDFSQVDLDAWLFAGEALDTSDADTARRKIDEKVDECIMKGDAEQGLYGLVNNPNVPVATLNASGTGSSVKWNTKTLAQISADIQILLDAVRTATKGPRGNGTVKPDTIKIAHSAFVYLTLTYKSDDSNITYLDALKATFAAQGLVNWEECADLDGAGVGGTDRVMVYKRAPENVFCILPEPFKILDAQYVGMAIVYNCYAKTAGTVFRRPTTACYGDGV